MTGSVRVDTLTCHKPSAFERNTGYTTRGCGRGRGRRVRTGWRDRARGKTNLHPLGAGTGTGAGASASVGVLAEAVRRHQAEVAAFK